VLVSWPHSSKRSRHLEIEDEVKIDPVAIQNTPRSSDDSVAIYVDIASRIGLSAKILASSFRRRIADRSAQVEISMEVQRCGPRWGCCLYIRWIPSVSRTVWQLYP
jgi:hypothetical protein